MDKSLVYGYCDVCDKRGEIKEYHLLTGKVVRFCLHCRMDKIEEHKHKPGKSPKQAEGDKSHQPYRYTQVD